MSSHLVEIAFKGNRKDFFLWEGDAPPPLKAPVVVEADRGEDLGYVHATGEAAGKRNAGTAHGYGQALPTHRARRLATPDEVRRLEELRVQDEDARRRAMERVKANQLVMKLSDAEWQWDRKKLTFYFTAEKRVDFRNLVRELAAMFRTRIELKQIGVRDEAKRLDGVGRCGRQYCSASWLPELRPVNLGVAKDQRLSLNPTQISGACGRLMCCLRYEHEFYVQQRRRFPKEGKIVRTAKGEEKVLANDIFRERVTLRGEDGEVRVVPLADLRTEIEGAGGAFTPAVTNGDRSADEGSAVEGMLDEGMPESGQPRGERRPPRGQGRGGAPRPESGERKPAERRPMPAATSRPDLDVPQLHDTGMFPIAVNLPVPTPPAAPGSDEATPAGEERRPHRRRGRRGGRRNRGHKPQGGTETGGESE